jgi:N-carbamoyl-L-amino-acid hydrolase
MPEANADRLWRSLMEMARIGATPKGGCARLALTDLDREARDLFVAWCREAGCEVTIDKIGNIFARRPGREPGRPPVLTGSHLDTQPHGGRFDGVYGVLAGLEAVRALNDAGVETMAPVEVVVWNNEEGVRFQPGLTGSGVFGGVYELDFALGLRDAEGRSFGDELARIGYAGEAEVGGRPLDSFFEAHIEQGPVLEREGKTIGVVTRVQGMRFFEVTVSGADAHAGTTPMEARRDAMVSAAAMVLAVDRTARENTPDARLTVGRLAVNPNSANTVPGEVTFSIDTRHPESATLDRLEAHLRAAFDEIAGAARLEVEMAEDFSSPPMVFDDACVAAVREATARLEYPHREMISGAGHDACYVSRVAPCAMVFVPCLGGLSHCEEESATPEDLAAGCHVLIHAILARAGRA